MDITSPVFVIWAVTALILVLPFIIIVAGATLGGLLLLQRLARKEATIRGNRFVLKYGWAWKAFAWFALLFFVFLGVILFSGEEVKLLTRFLLVAMLLQCSYVLIEAYFWRVEFDEEFIYVFSPWRRLRVIPWSEVTGCAVRFKMLNRWIHLETQKSGVIKFSPFLSGLGTLVEELDRRGIVLKGNKTKTSVSGESNESY